MASPTAATPAHQAEALRHLLALSRVEDVGPVVARNLVAYCGGALGVFQAPHSRLLAVPDVGPIIAQRVRQGPDLAFADHELEWAQRNHTTLLPYWDGAYPPWLGHTPQAPLVLYVQGQLLPDRPAVAVVGTRKPTEAGRRNARRIVEALVAAGVTIVSGLAYGIDAEAHKHALDLGGHTIAVLGHGLDTLYPAAHRNLAQRIKAEGALVSEYPTGVGPEAKHFVHRNRIISGLCRATVVVESAEKGGSLATARFAQDQGREVFAIPGSWDQPQAAGCNALIRDTVARLLTDPAEILAELELGWSQASIDFATPANALPSNLSELERTLANLVQDGHATLDALAAAANTPIAQVMDALLNLEFKGVVSQRPGMRYVRV